MKQLVYLGKAPNRNLEERILQVNPIMEAFGNARTGINCNSSRFGKYLDLTMTSNGKVTGARISVYLLEQSRVIHQANNEGNFHIFYYLYDGLEHENKLSGYYLDPMYRAQHRYLSKTQNSVQLNVERWKQLKSCFKLLGFQDDEVDMVNRVLAAILNLGDMEFGELISNDNTDNKARVVDMAPMHRVAKLLGVEATDLLEALSSNAVVTRGETINRSNTVTEATAARDAMSKGLYGRLFDWMVNQINVLLSFNRPNNDNLAIGLLDIFGFENFQQNSFEQLCINIANEQIQYYFNQHIFTWEQQVGNAILTTLTGTSRLLLILFQNIPYCLMLVHSIRNNVQALLSTNLCTNLTHVHDLCHFICHTLDVVFVKKKCCLVVVVVLLL